MMHDWPRRHILVVDDEEAIGHLIAHYLESLGYEVRQATEGEEALRDIAEHQTDLVILDLRLPDVNGLEVCRQLRQQYNSWTLPIIILTGLDASVDKLRGFSSGADAYLTKPFEPPELLPTVTRLLSQLPDGSHVPIEHHLWER